MDPDNNNVKIVRFFFKENRHQHNPKKSVLVYISGIWLQTQFLLLQRLSLNSRSIFSMHSFSFILPHFFRLHLPRVDQITGVDHCSISTFLKSLGVAVRLKIVV